MFTDLLKMKSPYAYSIKRDLFRVLTFMVSVLSFAALIIYGFLLKGINVLIFVDLMVLLLANAFLYFYLNRIKSFRLVSILYCVFVEFLALPVFTVYGVETASSTPMWYAGGIMVMLLLLDIHDFWWMFLIVLYWNTYLYTRNFVWAGIDTVINDKMAYFLGYAFSFGAIAFALNYVLIKIEKNFDVAESEIDKSREQEKNAGLAKSRFLANMSHEIRTPMNSIIGLSELALKDEMEDVVRSEVTTIKKSAYDLLEIIDDVLMYSKLDSGKVKLLNVDFKFDEMLKQVLDSVSNNVNGKDLKVRVKIDHNIPKIVNGDDIRIKQVIMRLIFISLSLTDNGRVMISIAGDVDKENKEVTFNCVISDTGCGLNKYDLDAIYGAYDTYDSRQNSNLKGIGLKFSICKELLALMDGSIEIQSIEGVGLETKFSFKCSITNDEPMISVNDGEKKNVLIYVSDNREYNTWKSIMEGFKIRPDYVSSYFSFDKVVQTKKYDYIFIPNECFQSVANIISSYSAENYTYIIANSNQSFGDFDKCRIIRHPVSCLSVVDVLNNKWKEEDYVSKKETINIDVSAAKILVVDDNAVNLKVASGIFKAYNAEIDMAKSGEEALKKMETTDYDLVLMDMVMPDLSGEDTLKKMRLSDKKSLNEVPVVALTANTGGNIREEILDKGFQEYLAKPIKQRYLTQCLVTFLPPSLIKKKAEEKKTEKTTIENVVNIPNKAPEEKKEENKALKGISKAFKEAVDTMDITKIEGIISSFDTLEISESERKTIKEIKEAFDLFDFKRLTDISVSICK